MTLYNSNFEILKLGGNNIRGTIPAKISSMSSLKELYLGNSQMGGLIPPELYRLESLQVVDLRNGTFEGELSEDFRLLNQTIQEITLDQNDFSGPVPAAFDVCKQLRK